MTPVRQDRHQQVSSRVEHLVQAGIVRSWFVQKHPGSGRRWIIEFGGMTRVYTIAEAEAFIEGAWAAVHRARINQQEQSEGAA